MASEQLWSLNTKTEEIGKLINALPESPEAELLAMQWADYLDARSDWHKHLRFMAQAAKKELFLDTGDE